MPDGIPAEFANGTEGPTDDATMDYFLRSIASRNTDWMTYYSADFQSEEGRSLPYVYLSMSTQNLVAGTNNSNKLKVWVQGGVHGNEPAGDQSLLALIGKMDANQTWTQSILATMDILVLPRYNVDGVAYFQRTLATNFDPNRDHIKLARQQTRDIKELFSSFEPHIAVDMHEFTAGSRYGGSYVHAADALFSAAKNPNINEGIRQLSEEVFAANIGTSLEAVGLRWEPYVTGSSNSTPDSTIRFAEAGSDAKIGRNAMGLTQSITFLCEMRGIGLADQHFQRRTVTGLVMAQAIIQTAADNAQQVYQTITDGIEEFINTDKDIIVTDSTEYEDRTFQMVDIANGTLVDTPVQFASTTPTTAKLTRPRPEAYIIPRAWADLAARLEVSGLEVTKMSQGFRGTVEALNITSMAFDETYYEGVVPVTVTTSATEKEVELPAGSFAVSTRQRNAGLAFVALEPENIDSYVAFNIIPVEEGDEYPIFRLLA
ncbi:hypothetical protein OHC33_002380 [Knufia fluminis]|uniref:Carboxypeptidase M14B n=1 Tax=Knufia fluminis TaxID=191047 RepID=A0AAN8FEG6_9EURO|nr:hypothetical protein OHC33_002380 [Knufia fluminis]